MCTLYLIVLSGNSCQHLFKMNNVKCVRTSKQNTALCSIDNEDELLILDLKLATHECRIEHAYRYVLDELAWEHVISKGEYLKRSVRQRAADRMIECRKTFLKIHVLREINKLIPKILATAKAKTITINIRNQKVTITILSTNKSETLRKLRQIQELLIKDNIPASISCVNL